MVDGSWHTAVRAPVKILEQIDMFVGSLCEIEQDNLVGVYLHGSLAMGCFHPSHSDLDLLILVRQPPPPEHMRAWAHQTLQSSGNPAPLELSVLTYSQYAPWQHPTPFTFHFSEDWRTSLLAALSAGTRRDWPQPQPPDPDLAGHFTVARHRGLRLAGAPISAALPDVPWPDYVDSIRRDFDWAIERAQDNPVYLVLNACRIWAALSDQLVLSKAEGAAWAMPRMPLEVQPIVAAATAQYRTGTAGTSPISGAQALAVAEWIAPYLL